MYTKAIKTAKFPYHIIIKPIGAVCNLNCSYCYYLDKKSLYPGIKSFRMTEEVLKNLTQQASSLLSQCRSSPVTRPVRSILIVAVPASPLGAVGFTSESGSGAITSAEDPPHPARSTMMRMAKKSERVREDEVVIGQPPGLWI